MAINYEVLENKVDRLVEEGLYRFNNDYDMVVEFLTEKMKLAKYTAEAQFDKKRKLAFTLLFEALKERISSMVIESVRAMLDQITIEA